MAAAPEPIPFLTLPNWVKAAGSCGFTIEPLFRRYGIPSDLVHLESVSVDPLVMEKLMEDCIASSPQQHFPFVLGERFAFDYLPDIETFLATSPTLRDAARVFDWVRTLINPMIDMRLEERGRLAHLLIDIRAPEERPSRPYFVESLFAAVHKFFRALTREQWQVERLTFRYAPPPYAAEYRKFFGMPVEFRRRENAAVLDGRLLDTPLSGAFPSLHKQAEYLVEKRLQKLPRRLGLVAAIENVFAEHPELLGQGIAQVSRRLGLEPRTLQRRLQEQKQSFAELQQHARYRLAMQMLEAGTDDIERISERLGFSDRRSFTRAFQRWNGMSPSEFRARRVG
jgi:AraC-like DNA-binding protein